MMTMISFPLPDQTKIEANQVKEEAGTMLLRSCESEIDNNDDVDEDETESLLFFERPVDKLPAKK